MDLDLTEETALVTGAGRGNGRAIATELAELGAAVIVNDLDEDAAQDVADELTDGGHDAVAVPADVTDEAAVERLVDRGTESLGPVSILVNNAGIGDAGPFLDSEEAISRERFRRNLAVHFWGALNCIFETVDPMVDRGDGKIVNITSIHTANGVGMSPEYDVGKFSLLGLTKSLALELGRVGVRVNAVAPGWVNTRMTADFTERTHEQIRSNNPLGRYAEPEDIASAVAFLASPAADYVNGHELRVDGGQVPIDNWKYDDR